MNARSYCAALAASLVLACGPKLPADVHFAREVAETVRDEDERCAKSGEADETIARCFALRQKLKPILLEADRPLDGGTP